MLTTDDPDPLKWHKTPFYLAVKVCDIHGHWKIFNWMFPLASVFAELEGSFTSADEAIRAIVSVFKPRERKARFRPDGKMRIKKKKNRVAPSLEKFHNHRMRRQAAWMLKLIEKRERKKEREKDNASS